jgi:RNA polymerase sigma-70 factor (ECF subfamily)
LSRRRIRKGTDQVSVESAEESPLTVALTEAPDISGAPASAGGGTLSSERASAPGFDAVYGAHRHLVMNVVRSVLGPGEADELEDVVQAVFIEVYRCLHRFEGRSKLTTWLYRISVNVALQHLRRKRRKRWLVLSETGEQPGETMPGISQRGRLEGRALLGRIYQATRQLSEKKRVVWALHDLQGLTPREISEILAVPHNTVRSRLMAARRALMEILAAEGLLGERDDA